MKRRRREDRWEEGCWRVAISFWAISSLLLAWVEQSDLPLYFDIPYSIGMVFGVAWAAGLILRWARNR